MGTEAAFTALTSDGQRVSLTAFFGRPLIVYFFHKAFTPNCTIETNEVLRFARARSRRARR